MDFEVIIIGSDANAYYMSRCYYEMYHKKVHLISAKPLSFVVHSNIINASFSSNLWNDDGFTSYLNDYVRAIKAKKIVCISSNETYARELVRNKNRLDKRIVFNYVDEEFLDNLMMKDRFYKKYGQSGLLPKTIIYGLDDPIDFDLTYPVIIKPANVITFNHIDFYGKKKIYKLNNLDEVKEVIGYFRNSEYNDNLIIQEYIPGDDSKLYDVALYSNSLGKVEFMTFAQIGLQEHSENMVGNAACLINGFDTNGYDENIPLMFKNFIESINFKGLAEIDIKYDERDKKYKILEINARQGRCGYYMDYLGCNPIMYVVDDLVYDRHKEFKLLKDKVLLTYVPFKIIKEYVINEEFKKEAILLKRKKKMVNPLIYKKDMPFKRLLFLVRKYFSYFKEFKNGYWKY